LQYRVTLYFIPYPSPIIDKLTWNLNGQRGARFSIWEI